MNIMSSFLQSRIEQNPLLQKEQLTTAQVRHSRIAKPFKLRGGVRGGWFVIVFHFFFATQDTKRNTVKSKHPNQTIDS